MQTRIHSLDQENSNPNFYFIIRKNDFLIENTKKNISMILNIRNLSIKLIHLNLSF